MAGVGRRTLYRKSVTDEYLNSTPEPGENEEIALVQAPRGSNIIEIMLATGEQALAILPTRFRKLIWVKRGDYLITSTSAGDFETSAGEAGKVRHRVEHILNKDQIKHLKKRDLWPGAEAFGGVAAATGPGSGTPRDAWGDPAEEAAPTEGNAAAALDAVDAGVSSCCIKEGATGGEGVGEKGETEEQEEEEEEDEEDDMSDLFVNNNRAAMMQLRTDHDDDEESDSDSTEDSGR